MAGVLEELDSKLASTFQIKNKPMTSGDEVDKLEVFILPFLILSLTIAALYYLPCFTCVTSASEQSSASVR